MQELEGLAPSKIQDQYYSIGGTFALANNYVVMLLQIADNVFSEGLGTRSQEEGEDHLYHLYMFRQYTDGWVDRSSTMDGALPPPATETSIRLFH